MKYSKKRRISWRDDLPLLITGGIALVAAVFVLTATGLVIGVKTQLFSGGQKLAFGYYDERTHQAEVAYAPLGQHIFAGRALGSPDERAGKYMSSAFDAQGRLHLVYYNETKNSLMHAVSKSSNLSDEWTIETIATNGGKDTSLVIDASGKLYVSYLSTDFTQLWVATSSGSGWSTQLANSSLSGESSTSIGINQAGTVFVAFYANASGAHNVYVTDNSQGSWVAAKVATSGGGAKSVSLKVDHQDKLHIAYLDDAQMNLYYLTNKSGQWVTTLATTPGTAQGGASLALDDSDNPGIAYHSSKNDLLYFTYYFAEYGNGTGHWFEQWADATAPSGYAPSMVLNGSGAAGTVHIAEYQKDTGQIVYATNAGTSGNSFVAFTSERAEDDAGSLSMAMYPSYLVQVQGGSNTGGASPSPSPSLDVSPSPSPSVSPSASPVSYCQLVDQPLYQAHIAGIVFTDLAGPNRGAIGSMGVRNGSDCTVLETLVSYRVDGAGRTSFFDQTIVSVPPHTTRDYDVNIPTCHFQIASYAGVARAGNFVNTAQHPLIYKEMENVNTACN